MTETYDKLPRFWCGNTASGDEDIRPQQKLTLAEASWHHLQHVLRKKQGDQIRIFNQQSGEWLATICDMKSHVVMPLRQLKINKPIVSEVILAVPPIKKTAMGFLLQKSTELGVSAIQPIITRHTTSGLNINKAETQLISASEQCERCDIPKLFPTMPLPDFLDSLDKDVSWFACVERSISSAELPLADEIMQKNSPCKAGFILGPEGGFHQDEIISLSQNKQICSISLGPRVLRVDTAALVVLALWRSRYPY